MERLALIGVSHRRGGAGAIEAYQEAYAGADRLHELGLNEFVVVATCNRWDVALVMPPEVPLEDIRRRLTPAGRSRPYAYVADGALEHLTRVASSLESLNPGEDQIMRQVRTAYVDAQHDGTTGPTTSFAFDAALRAAKRVRREVALAPLRTSLFSLARPALAEVLSPGTSVVILGAGEMGALAARSLSTIEGVRVVLVNRNLERAQAVATPLGLEAMALDTYLANPISSDALVAATPVRNLIGATLLDRLPGLRLAVDLGIPRNVDNTQLRGRNVKVLDVDGLQEAGRERRHALAGKLADAERIVQEELAEAIAAWTERQLGPSIRKLQEMYLATIGDSLPPDAAQRLAHRFAHVPVKGLRAVAREHGFDAASTFLVAAGLAESGFATRGEDVL